MTSEQRYMKCCLLPSATLFASHRPKCARGVEPNVGCVGPNHYIHLSIQRLAQPLHRIHHDVAWAHDRLVPRRLHPRAGRFYDPMHLVDGAVYPIGDNQAGELAVG
jgi:hypothetical protein